MLPTLAAVACGKRLIKGFSFCMMSSEKRNNPVMTKTLPKTNKDSRIRMRLFIDRNKMANIAKNRNARLKIRCSFHPNFSKIPPHEQGIK
ncbi:hypothetical protein D3C86_1753620 [compost metagenome]